ncbi:Uma2 family endonuclease [Aphanizomenon flos-aquae NRERC-008]|jgi:Uma2 family endonuclease|uniref:Uma2 family endonuclease n=2 Tax=Aphanizomenonaceae TaxID=1892259 RepID=A0ABR8IPJ4_APHFL|nr:MULTISPECIES: Uma2 family endonuclease [Aphanizomenon]MCE2906133.1 Uma2 family endonuclease [Anabaena sp. CoA2_C59]MDJ0504042.1 Uma2 family endonuclease [Nostocales cyanobacterium LE14-WE12]MBD2389796.1 Uma2 family endonuclease [Aphanizomenon flos-aquae FACHB-1171]MBD2557548.1 Uma2 family endonuclease [Aphanizomenon flos-aquae FACHB-1290]MBD2631334.1 Uma2 family endonuclease [Aphanizomenon sp. FACHB-1399]
MMTSEAVVLNIKNVELSDDQFYQLCQINEDWKLEQTAKGELIIMPPVGAISGNRESEFNADVVIWNRQTKLGKVFSSSTVFTLPNGGKRSPDVAWIVNERWESLNIQEKEKFAKICPDFIIELRSRTDSLSRLQEKMQEYLDSGLGLGWLIDPQNQQVEIYRQNQTVEIVSLPTTLSGEDILPGFILELPVFKD